MKANEQMLQFNVGDEVAFENRNGGITSGVVSRLNQKTVTIITHCGHRWNVAPSFLFKVVKDGQHGKLSATLLPANPGRPK